MAAAAAAKAFDGSVRGDGRQRRRTEGRKEGRKGRANSGNPIASSPREGKKEEGDKEAASMTDGRRTTDDFVGKCISQLEAASLGHEQMEASPSPSSSRFAEEEEEIGERIDPAMLARRFRCR